MKRLLGFLAYAWFLATASLPAEAADLSLSPSQWGYIEANIKKFSLFTAQGGGLAFNFPVDTLPVGSRSAHVDYLTSNQALPPLTSASVLMVDGSVTTTGAPVFDYAFEASNTCVFPAHARLILLVKNWQTAGEYGRWWSNPTSFQLAAGPFGLTVPLNPDLNQWSDVYGHHIADSPEARAGFLAALKNAAALGVTFGGGCFFGHGVAVTGGTAQFTLTGYSVQ